MSQNWQQPQQPQQPGGYGYPQQPQQPQYGGGFPPPPPPAPQPQGNAGLAIVAGLVAAIVGGFLYAFLLSTFADTDGPEPEVTQFAYAGVALGALVGLAIAKIGGRNTGLWVVGAILATIGVFIGELFGYAMIMADVFGNHEQELKMMGEEAPSAFDLFTHLTSPVLDAKLPDGSSWPSLFDGWKEDADGITWVFMALSPVAAIGTAYRVSNS